MSSPEIAGAPPSSKTERYFQPFCTIRHMDTLTGFIEDDKPKLILQDAFPAFLTAYHQPSDPGFRPTLLHLYPEGTDRAALATEKDPWAALAEPGPSAAEVELIDCGDEWNKRPIRQWVGTVTVAPTGPAAAPGSVDGKGQHSAAMSDKLDLPGTCREVLDRASGTQLYTLTFEGVDEDLTVGEDEDGKHETWTATVVVPAANTPAWRSYAAQGTCPYSSVMSVPLKCRGYHALFGARIASATLQDFDGSAEDEGSLDYTLPSGYSTVNGDRWQNIGVRLSAARMQLLTSRMKYNLNHLLHGDTAAVTRVDLPHSMCAGGGGRMRILPTLAAFVVGPPRKKDEDEDEDSHRTKPAWLHIGATSDRLPVDPPAKPVFARSLTNIVSTWQDFAKTGKSYPVTASVICDGEKGVITTDAAQLAVRPVCAFDLSQPGQVEAMRELLPSGTSSHIVNILSATPRVSFYDIVLRRNSGVEAWETRIAVPGTPKNPCLAVSVESADDAQVTSLGIASPLLLGSEPNAYIVSRMVPDGENASRSEDDSSDDGDGEKQSL